MNRDTYFVFATFIQYIKGFSVYEGSGAIKLGEKNWKHSNECVKNSQCEETKEKTPRQTLLRVAQ